MCHGGIRRLGANEFVEMALHAFGRPLLLTGLFRDGRVAPAADEEAAVVALAPVAIAPVRVRRPLEHPSRDGRRREHLSSHRPDAKRDEMGRVRVRAHHHRPRSDPAAAGRDLRGSHREGTCTFVEARTRVDRCACKAADVADRVKFAVVLIDRRTLGRHDPDAHALARQTRRSVAHLRPLDLVTRSLRGSAPHEIAVDPVTLHERAHELLVVAREPPDPESVRVAVAA